MNACAVIVCYHPDSLNLQRLCESLLESKARVILVDNSEQPEVANDPLFQQYETISQGENTGIASAQNAGIARAREVGADVVIFFDQDSQISSEFLYNLSATLECGVPLIVAPVCVDAVSGVELPSTVVTRSGRSIAIRCRDALAPQSVDAVIASGTAATIEVFDVAGLLDEDLFIDYVDTEWCLRCRSYGIPIRVVPTAVMKHEIGSKTIRCGPLTVSVHSPSRCYYQIRNSLLLFRKSHIPSLFALREVIATLVSRALLLLFVESRVNYMRAYAGALSDGMRGIAGRGPGW